MRELNSSFGHFWAEINVTSGHFFNFSSFLNPRFLSPNKSFQVVISYYNHFYYWTLLPFLSTLKCIHECIHEQSFKVSNFSPVKCLKEACSRDHFPILLHFSIGSSAIEKIGAKLGNCHVKKSLQTLYWRKIWYPGYIHERALCNL